MGGGPTRFGKYDLLALLATGGMAEIWLARVSGAAGFEKLVVIKRLLDQLTVNPEYIEMFLDEARINARLSHTNVVQVLELGQVEGKYFMAMEYVAGLSVAQVGKRATQRLGDVPQEVACGVVAQACAGLHHAHERAQPDGTPLGIIHRDVSPQNLILTFEGLVKVLDFGIAKAEGRTTQTRAGLVKGKSAYMSPEQCLGLPLDRRSDVFALGIVLFELATARRLFKRQNSYQTFEAITRAEVPGPRTLNPKIDGGIETVILRALAKRPEDRFESASEMQDALDLAMHKAGLRGSRSDLEKFVEKTFAREMDEQRRLLMQAERGELGGQNPALVSAVAVEAVNAERAAGYAARADSDEKTSIDELPPLGEDSGRTPLAEVDQLAAAAAIDPTVPATPNPPLGRDTVPEGVPALSHDAALGDTAPSGVRSLGNLPPLYLAFAVLGALLVVIALVWLIAF
ncbi:MAG: serine/threonine protein kinase [Polyangia bacterium]